MQIKLSEREHALLRYIAEYKPFTSKATLEYAKHSGIHRSDVKDMIDRLSKHNVIAWWWDGFNTHAKRWHHEWNMSEVREGAKTFGEPTP